MKRLFGYALMLALVAAPAFAAKNSQTVSFAQNVKVGTTEIPAGDVKVSWTGTGDTVQVTMTEGKTTTTFPARIIQEKHSFKSYVVSTASGSPQLQTIQLKDISLELTSPTASGQ